MTPLNSAPATWQCPACKTALQLQSSTWRCRNGHSFDQAKEGYVNLLLAQHKNSKSPGDNKDMVLARRAFLQHGYYQALGQRLAEVLQKNMDTRSVSQPWQFFDAGCGEGYYMGAILAQLKRQGYMVQASGIDISKAAVQQAAKKHKNMQFAVASTFDLPLAANSQHAVMQVFAPASSAQIHRVLVDNGIWLSINPASDHLFELKSMVYDTPQQHSAELNIAEGFRLLEHHRLRFVINLDDPEQRHNLLMMTPFYWSISEEKKLRLQQHLQTVTADFSITVLAKH
jgi:23S rRNA (guanine745-N1)-methyltransferase